VTLEQVVGEISRAEVTTQPGYLVRKLISPNCCTFTEHRLTEGSHQGIGNPKNVQGGPICRDCVR
jgi:hypothetical protein